MEEWKIVCIFAPKKWKEYGSYNIFTVSNEGHWTDGHVKSDEQMKEIGNLLSDYFAQKAVQEADKLLDDTL